MEWNMTMKQKFLLGPALGAAALALSVGTASAFIACSGNVCWHATERYSYPAESRVIVHEDSWKWGPSERFSWREHEGRGYWNGDRWTEW